MKRARYLLHLQFYFLFLSLTALAQNPLSLPRSTPEAEGVSSQAIINFLEAAEKSKHEFHSYMILRHGKVIAEGWWNPYAPSLKHSMYSVSKSFTATAIGFAVSEGRMRVTDKVISFFPADLPDSISPNLAALAVKDLLTMSVGQQTDPTGSTVAMENNWVKAFLKIPLVHQPGTTFLYNSLATYTLSAIVQKVTGEKIIDYLKPRLFDPIGIKQMDWETDPKSINTGGWGLRITTEDMAKFGQLFLQKGSWQGKQVLPKDWVEEASTVKIIQHPGYSKARQDSSDWEQGYCYQMWRCRNNAYRGDGAFGQFIIVMPDQDAVIIITAETSDMQGEINLVWNHLLPAMQPGRLPENKLLVASLKKKSSSLQLPLPALSKLSAKQKKISGKIFSIDANDLKIKNLSFQFSGSTCTLKLITDTSQGSLTFSTGKWSSNLTSRPGPYLLSRAKNNLKGLPAFKATGAFSWTDPNTLALTLRYIESPHTELFTCHFTEEGISVDITNSLNRGEKTILNGMIQKQRQAMTLVSGGGK